MSIAILDKEKFGPWALITGASSGIGEGFARQIAANGINVVLVARRLNLLEELGRDLKRRYQTEYLAIQADLSQDNFMRKLVTPTKELDIGLVVSNAGTATPGSFLKRDLGDMVNLFKLNAQAHLEISHHFGQRLAQRGRGGIMLTGAMGAVKGVPYVLNESASKSFVQTLGEASTLN
jgi:short-subunit dehydrogenase